MNAGFPCHDCRYYSVRKELGEVDSDSINCLQCFAASSNKTLHSESDIDQDVTLGLTQLGQDNSESATAQPAQGSKPAQRTQPTQRTGAPVTTVFPEIPGFEVNSVLAKGGMGIIYLGRDILLNRSVVIKTIRSEIPLNSARKRFQKEATAVARLNHPNVVQLYELVWFDSRPFMVFEYADIGNLDQAIRMGTLPEDVASTYVEQIAHAVQFAHNNGILHRDLKPSNILLDRSKKNWLPDQNLEKESSRLLKKMHESGFDTGQVLPKVADFGLTRLLSDDDLSNPSRAESLLGTPSYMAPECFTNKFGKVSEATDVYGIGTILYACLTGRAPFTGNNLHEITGRILHSELLSVKLFNPTVSADMEAICYKCLEKDPKQRYQSPSEIANDLIALRRGQTISIKRASVFQKIGTWARLHKAATILSMILLFTGLLIVGILTVFNHLHNQKIRRIYLASLASEQSTKIEGIVRSKMVVIEALTSFLSQDEEYRDPEFKSYCSHLVNMHGEIAALEWAPCVPQELINKNEELGKKLYGGRYQIHKFADTDEEEFRTGLLSNHLFPVLAAVPIQGNELALGLDLNSEGNRSRALRQSIRDNRLTISGPIFLHQDEQEHQTAFLAIKPVWTHSKNPNLSNPQDSRPYGPDGKLLRGIGVGVFRIDELVSPMFDGFENKIRVEIIDTTDGHQVLYSQFPRTPRRNSPSRAQMNFESAIIKPFGREWEIRFYLSPNDRLSNSRPVFGSLTCGLLLTTMISGIPIIVQLARGIHVR